jgi:hypothetical protein
VRDGQPAGGRQVKVKPPLTTLVAPDTPHTTGPAAPRRGYRTSVATTGVTWRSGRSGR